MPDKKMIAFISGSDEVFRVCRERFETVWTDGALIRIFLRDELEELTKNGSAVCFVVEDLFFDKSVGEQWIRWIRQRDRNALIIVLAADTAAERRLELFKDGADGCVCQPFDPEELLYLIRSFTRRRVQAAVSGKVVLESALVDIATAEVTRNGQVSRLTGTEYRIFRILLENAGRIVSVSALCREICGDSWEGYEKTLMTHIYHLREKIEAKPSVPVSLVTIKGLGYRLNIVAIQ